MELHKLLQRQIKKFLPTLDWESDEQMKSFLNAIGESYKNYEQDQALSQHAFEIADQEYYEITQKLLEQNQLRDQSINNLRKTVEQLDEGATNEWIKDSNDIINITQYLDNQVQKRKAAEEDLKKAIKVSEQATRAKSDFLSTMSHEIRSPLNVIIGTTHILKLESHLPSQAENFEVLDIASNNLLLLINDILDFNKIEAGKLELEYVPVDIKGLVLNVKKANTVYAEEKGNNIKVLIDSDIPDILIGDGGRIGQVITNLVSNAIKFTDNGSIQIILSLLEQKGDFHKIRVEVKDTGIGIPEKLQQKILEEFTQAGSDITRNYGGTGLGLAISKKLLELMDSSIQVESKTQSGSRFFFDLTMKEAISRKKVVSENKESRDLGAARVLAVDDLMSNLVVLKKITKGWNIKLDTCNNGKEAVDKVKTSEYDLVLMDIQMPVMDGKEATTEIRKFNTQIPILAFTALYDQNFRNDLIENGMSDFVSKPFNPDNLFLKLKKHLSR